MQHNRALSLVALLAVLGLAAPGRASGAETSLTYVTPRAGRVTIALNDAQGRRMRNLIGDAPVTAGEHRVVWDGLDDQGRVAPPGSYHWVGLTRGDLHLIYRGRFTEGDPPWLYGKTGGWLADHHPPCAVVALGDSVLIGSGVSEWGHGLVRCDLEGHKQWGVRWLSRAAWVGVASMATDGERVFATGFPGWQQDWVWEVNPETGDSWPIVQVPTEAPTGDHPSRVNLTRPAPYEGPLGFRVVGARRVGPTRWDGELYVSDVLGPTPRTYVYTTARAPQANDATGYYFGGSNTWYNTKLLRILPVRVWGLTWLPDGRCVAVLDQSLAVLDTTTGATTPLVTTGLEAPWAITSDSQGRLYVSDRGGQAQRDNVYSPLRQPGLRTSAHASMQVKIFDRQGRPLAVLGRAGGQQPGQIVPTDLSMPGGLTIDARGRLCVTEERWDKRVTVWEIPADLSAQPPRLAREFFGPGTYGEGAYMLDPRRPNLITTGSAHATFDVDLSAGTFREVAVPLTTGSPSLYGWLSFPEDFPFGNEGFESAGENWQATLHDTISYRGRVYQWYAREGFAVVGERTAGGGFHPLAACGTIFNYMQQAGRYSDHWVPLPILEAVKRSPDWPRLAQAAGLDPQMTDVPHTIGIWDKWPKDLNFFNWTDTNGDGLMQADEVTVSRLMAHHGAPLFAVDSQLDALLSVYGTLYRMVPQSFTAGGAPVYDWSKAAPFSRGSVGTPTATLEDGSLLITDADDGVLRFVGPDGQTRWTYPSLYGGHSHRNMSNQRQRVTTPGAIYGAWNLQGLVAGPGTLGQFFMLHAGHGENYLLTLDGLFIGTLFKSVYDGNGEQMWDNLPQAQPGMLLDGVSLQDECFNGSLARAEATAGGFQQGHYYLLGLGRRVVVELTGMDTVQRLPGGEIAVSADSAEAARQALLTAAAAPWTQPGKRNSGDIPYARAFSPQLFWEPQAAVLPGARICLWHNEQGLGVGGLLDYRPGTPLTEVFTNPAASWEYDFAAGDAVDLQLGNPAADPARTRQEPGDQRLVFAERGGKLEVVRYRWLPVAQAPPGARILPEGRAGDLAWVAELLEFPDAAVTRVEPIYYHTTATFQVTLPWPVLGLPSPPPGGLSADLGYTRRLPGGAGLSRANWATNTGPAAYDLGKALRMRPDLWRSFALRPAGYVFPPDVSSETPATGGQPLLVDYTKSNARVAVSYGGAYTWVWTDPTALHLKWYVTGADSLFVNKGTDWTLLFKTGDGCDLQLASPTLGRCRYLITVFQGQPVVVRYQFDAKHAAPEQGVSYRSPTGEFVVPLVEQLPLVPQVTRGEGWYTVEVALPWATLGVTPRRGLDLPAEFGVLRADPTGSTTASRTYWNSGLSGMVMDTPTEARPTDHWGTLRLR